MQSLSVTTSSPDDGSLRRIPQRIANELPFGRDGIPEFAGTRQRVVNIVLELEDAKPARILDARGSYFEFDDEGRVDEYLRRTYLWEQLTVPYEKRATRDEAGRLLMIDKAGWLDGNIEIHVNIRSALEWRPEDWD